MIQRARGPALPSVTRSPRLERKGFVLVAVLIAIVLIGAIAASVIFATTEDTRAGSAGIARDMALIATESAIAVTLGDPGLALPSPIGVAGTVSHRLDEDGSAVTIYITRLDSAIYWIVADAVPDRARSGARRRIGVLVTAVKRDDGFMAIDPVSERYWSELF